MRHWFHLAIAVLLSLAIGFIVGVEVATSHVPEPPVSGSFQPFTVTPRPIPTPIVGLYEYGYPINVAIPVATAAPGSVPAASPRLVRDTAANGTGGQGRIVHLRGYAVWHATGRDGLYAAAGPILRRALGPGWRSSRVLVCKRLRCVEVRLSDWCRCRHGRRLLDLSDEAFAWLAPLSRGVIRVMLEGFR